MSQGSDEGRYRLLVEAITDYAIYMLDREGHVSSWNPGAQRFKGYIADEIVGAHFSRFYTDEDQAAGVPARALKTAAEEGRFEAEGWRVRKDGSRFWAHVIIDPIRGEGGDLIGFAKITRDLTERRQTEEALRQSEQQFRLLVQGVTDYAIYMLDLDGRVASWNAGAQRIKGYAPTEIIGGHFSRFYTEQDRQADLPREALTTAAREGRFEKEGWRLRKDGSRFWAHVVIDAIKDDAAEVIGFAKVTRDFTERAESQKALEEAREALFQAQKIEALGQLTGGVAHDFNNLLMAVMGSLELVRKRLPDDPRITPLLENAMQGAQRGAALTQRMLAFARKQDLRLQSVDLPALVRGLVDFLQRTIGPRIHIRLTFPSGLSPVRSDPNQLEAALMNLVVNARDAMPDGGEVIITAEVRQHAGRLGAFPGGDYVRLRVEDTGSGMDAETLVRAAEPFFTTKGVGKGTGLGLSMVHGLAAQTGGWLEIDSGPGKGTRVDLWLPVAGGDAIAPQNASVQAVARPDRRLAILAVDDDNLVLTNTIAMLEDLGFETFAASSGREGLELLERQPDIAALVTDEVMPEMSGSQLALAARAMKPNLPILVASGYPDLRADAGKAVVELPRLSKPFTQAQLAAAVAAIVGEADRSGEFGVMDDVAPASL